MPTIEISHRDLCGLVGKSMSAEEIAEAVLYAKGELDEHRGDLMKIDVKDTNRPDLWSTEGIAREIRGRLAPAGMPKYKVGKSGITVKVDKKMKGIRPYTVCAVVRGLDIEEDVLLQMIQLQEKISLTFGRNRKEVAIGAYDLHKIKPPIKFTSVKPNGIRFIPLEFRERMTPAQILKKHPKGKEFGHLLEGLHEYPIFIDSAGEVLSMPPIINSDHTGKVSGHTRDIFIECSGFNMKFLVPALNTLVAALADRGGKIETVDVIYPDKKTTTPDLTPKAFSLDVGYAKRLSGLEIGQKEIRNLLEKAGYETSLRGRKIRVSYPAYRQDIMHQRDLVEDILISYGYNSIEPLSPALPTVGGQEERETFSNTVAELMANMGCQEIMSYILSSKESLFEKMGEPEGKAVEIENAISSNWCIFRDRLLPSLLEFFSKNKHREFPQKIFEIGDAVLIDEKAETKTSDIRKLAAAISNTTVGYEEISGILDALFSNLGIGYSLKKKDKPSFIKGRCAVIFVGGKESGVIGEIHPLVLNRWGIDNPVVAMEINLEALLPR